MDVESDENHLIMLKKKILAFLRRLFVFFFLFLLSLFERDLTVSPYATV